MILSILVAGLSILLTSVLNFPMVSLSSTVMSLVLYCDVKFLLIHAGPLLHGCMHLQGLFIIVCCNKIPHLVVVSQPVVVLIGCLWAFVSGCGLSPADLVSVNPILMEDILCSFNTVTTFLSCTQGHVPPGLASGLCLRGFVVEMQLRPSCDTTCSLFFI